VVYTNRRVTLIAPNKVFLMQNSQQPAKPRASMLKQLITFLVLVVLFMVIARFINTWLGKQAIAENNLTTYSYEQAVALSQQHGKPLLLNFSAIWCGACRRFESRVLGNEAVKQALENQYYYVRLEYESDDRAVFTQYGVRGFPTVLVQSAGAKARQLPTSVQPQEFLQSL